MIDFDEEREYHNRYSTVLTVTCESCPLQIEGIVYGRKIYYRARHNRFQVYCPWNYTVEELDKPLYSGECTNHQQDSVSFALVQIAKAIKRFEEYA